MKVGTNPSAMPGVSEPPLIVGADPPPLRLPEATVRRLPSGVARGNVQTALLEVPATPKDCTIGLPGNCRPLISEPLHKICAPSELVHVKVGLPLAGTIAQKAPR